MQNLVNQFFTSHEPELSFTIFNQTTLTHVKIPDNVGRTKRPFTSYSGQELIKNQEGAR